MVESVGEGVVESARGRVRVMREPINPTRASGFGAFVDSLDRRSSGALPSRFRRSEQIMHVAIVTGRPGRARSPTWSSWTSCSPDSTGSRPAGRSGPSPTRTY